MSRSLVGRKGLNWGFHYIVLIKIFLCFKKWQKMWWESDVMKQWKNLLLVAYVFNVYIFMRNVFLWKWGFRNFQNRYIKLFASNDKQIDNHTSMPDMFHSNMSVVCTCQFVEVFSKIFFGMAVVLCWSL